MIISALTAAYASAEIVAESESRYVAVRLVPEIYNHAGADLSDLRIVTENGGAVPFFLRSCEKNARTETAVYPMECINAYLERADYVYDYKLSQPRDGDVTATAILFMPGGVNFAKTLNVYGGYDNVHWEFVQNDNIYAVDGHAKYFVYLNKPCKYTHYRIKINNNLEKITFDYVELHYNEDILDETFFIETLTPVYTVENADKETRVIIEGMKHLRLCDITIESDGMFMRTAAAPGVKKEIYNLTFNGETYADTTIPMDRHMPENDTFTITIDNGDDAPIFILGVTARYYADDAVFEQTDGETYILTFGGEQRAPDYDIERYKYEILKGEVGKAELGVITRPELMPHTDYRMLFNAATLVVAAFLGAVIFIKLKNGK